MKEVILWLIRSLMTASHAALALIPARWVLSLKAELDTQSQLTASTAVLVPIPARWALSLKAKPKKMSIKNVANATFFNFLHPFYFSCSLI